MVGADIFDPAPMASPAGHAWPLDETERRLQPLLDVLPITRVYDATSLDRLGLPVWAAVTPLAKDLKVHAGKGTSHRAARLSAVMEAIERVSAEQVSTERTIRASYRQLRHRCGDAVLDPELFDLPFETVYGRDRPCGWVGGYDLVGAREVWVAADLVISPAQEGICIGVETNGLAAGNTVVEAVLHALYEVIERDAAAHQRFARLYGEGSRVGAVRLVDRATLPAVAVQWTRALSHAAIEVSVHELTHDVGVPVFRAVLYDSQFPGREGTATTFEGLGADLDGVQAVVRALSEAVQAHTAVLVGARDTFEGGQSPPIGVTRLIERLQAGTDVTPFPAPAGELPADLAQRLAIALQLVRDAGFAHCVAVELTRPDLGIPVVRVLLAGAAGPYGETARRPARRLLRALV